MANPPIDSYNGNGLTLATYLDGILQRNNEMNGVATSPHKNFWETLTYQQFTTGNVPGVVFGPTRHIPSWSSAMPRTPTSCLRSRA
jgi:hypothetical protein